MTASNQSMQLNEKLAGLRMQKAQLPKNIAHEENACGATQKAILAIPKATSTQDVCAHGSGSPSISTHSTYDQKPIQVVVVQTAPPPTTQPRSPPAKPEPSWHQKHWAWIAVGVFLLGLMYIVGRIDARCS